MQAGRASMLQGNKELSPLHISKFTSACENSVLRRCPKKQACLQGKGSTEKATLLTKARASGGNPPACKSILSASKGICTARQQ